VSLAEKHYKFERSWRKYVVVTFGIVIPAVCFLSDILHVNNRYREQAMNSKREKLYDVTYFIARDTLQPLLTDTLRWRRFALAYKNSAVIYSMQDKADYYDCDVDTMKHIFTLHNNPDTASWFVFHYSYPQKNMFQLRGNWKGNDVSILMKEIPLDSMALNKERITFFQE
jgi:hypothetical protein